MRRVATPSPSFRTKMGAGASLESPLPKTAEDALAAGYTQEQIDEYTKKKTDPDAARATLLGLMFPTSGDSGPNETDMAASFSRYDTDGNGELDKAELCTCFTDLATTLLKMTEDLDADVRPTLTSTPAFVHRKQHLS